MSLSAGGYLSGLRFSSQAPIFIALLASMKGNDMVSAGSQNTIETSKMWIAGI